MEKPPDVILGPKLLTLDICFFFLLFYLFTGGGGMVEKMDMEASRYDLKLQIGQFDI